MRFAAFAAPCLLLATLFPCVYAQDAPSPTGPPKKSKAVDPNADQDLQGPMQTLKIGTQLVNLYFTAHDKSGFITNLRKDDCLLAEDKVPQTIKNFTQEKNLPLTIGILLDTSGSQTNVLPLEQESGAEFLRDVLTPKDEAFLISFDINIDLLADYTSSARELKRAIDKARINTGVSQGGVTGNAKVGGTHLYDAVYLAAHDKLRQEAGRKVLVMLTDGGEEGSEETLKSATEAAQKANAIIYVILIADRANFGFGGTGDMERLARDTGGRVIDVGNNGKKLQAAFDQIQDELRTQYLVSYTPKNLDFNGKFRAINLDCGKDLKVVTRKGYYAIADGDPDEK